MYNIDQEKVKDTLNIMRKNEGSNPEARCRALPRLHVAAAVALPHLRVAAAAGLSWSRIASCC